MALQIASKLPSAMFGKEIDFPTAYARIVEVIVRDPAVTVTVAYFVDVTARAVAGTQPFMQNSYEIKDYNHDDPRPFKQALYDWLKALPEFQGSVDV